MNKFYIFCLLLTVRASFGFAQNQNNIWYFGAKAGLDFNSGSPVAITNSHMLQVEGTAVMSDENGNLLFYTDGKKVWNANHDQMPNGFDLLGNISSTQSALIVPKNCGSYYLFTVPSENNFIPLSYSIVDMNADGGLGDITLKNVELYHPVNERLTATLDSSGTGYWVVAQEHQSNAILSYHINPAGIDTTPVITTISDLADTGNFSIMTNLGYMKFSPDGSKLCYTFLYYNNTSVVLDFDKNTGTVSNPVVLQQTSGGYGVEFSPDNSKLYIESVNCPFQIWQYDLAAGSATDIQNSAFLLDSQYYNSGSFQYGGALQLAPNGKIYVNRLQRGFVGVIKHPNLQGALCSYVDSAVYLNGKYCQDGLPNFIKQYAPMIPPPVPPVITQTADTLISSFGYSYKWFLNGNIIPGATSQQIIISQTGNYSVELTDSNGCPASALIEILFFPSPGFAASDTIVCEKFCVDFVDTSTNNPTTWQWNFPGGSPAFSFVQNPTSVCYNSPGVYDVILITTTTTGIDTLVKPGFITVNSTPPIPVITQNGNVLTSTAASAYQWQLNSVDIPGATNQSYTATQSGLFTVIIGDANGCTNSATMDIVISEVENIKNQPTLSVWPNPSNGIITVEWSEHKIAQEISLEVVNSLSQTFYISTEQNTRATFRKDMNLETLSNGIYFINLKTKENFCRKMIVISR